MLQNQIAEINRNIPSQDGKIIHTSGGLTSELMKRLYLIGYRATTSGIMHYLYDANGKKVATAHSWVYLLAETAKIKVQ